MKQVEFKAMGSRMAVFLDRDSQAARSILDQVPAWFEEWEQILSRFRADSDLSRLNASAGQPVRVHPFLFEVIHLALASARWTHGLVTPTLLKPLERAGYTQSFESFHPSSAQAADHPAAKQQDPPVDLLDWSAIEIDVDEMSVFIPGGMGIDLGGIGKGWAADQAMRRLEEVGPVLVDASGDLAVSGPRWDGSPWPVGIADPLRVQENLGLLALNRCGVATSGIDYHRWLKDGAWQHHIIDPRTAAPVDTDLISVTVTAPDAIQAEAAAKAVLILGQRDGLEWLERQSECAGLLALSDGQVVYSRDFQNIMWS